MRKIYLVILDGAADRPIGRLNGLTPLEAAHTPALDDIAQESQHALIKVIGDDVWPESDSGAMALLSYDPLLYYTGRGPLEGFGLDFSTPGENSISFRFNFASYDELAGTLDRRTARGLSDDELQELARAIRSEVSLDDLNVTFQIMAFSRHRGILSLTSDTSVLSGQVTNTDPGFRNVGAFGFPIRNYSPHPLRARPRDPSLAAAQAAKAVNEFVVRSARVLRDHPVNRARQNRGELPANLLLVRDGGDPPSSLDSFYSKFGCTVSIFGQIPAERGLAKLMGGRFEYSRPMAKEAYAKVSLKKYRPIAARNEDKKVFSGLL
ncbi:MAG: hypothetical protein JOZ09_07090 [Pseudonocardiales bacterium]|nr:hypothetical protein [Pseudonocardiales bacterium]MBV9763699.1 hypothetical protein [Acidobacteriaceae bacterium]